MTQPFPRWPLSALLLTKEWGTVYISTIPSNRHLKRPIKPEQIQQPRYLSLNNQEEQAKPTCKSTQKTGSILLF